MRVLLLAGIAGLAFAVAAPAFAAPIHLGLNVKYNTDDVNQTIVHQNQTINHASRIHTWPWEPAAVQIGANVAINDTDSTQNLTQDQTVNGPHYWGGAYGTQAVQIGANVDYNTDSNTQNLTQTQTVNEHGYSGGVQAVQVGANVAINSSGGSQSITQTQTVNQ